MKIILIFIFPFCLHAQWIETAGDILQLALPAWAWGETYHHDDLEGRHAFYRAYGTTIASTYALKYTVQKPRPDASNNLSFPSGHTSSAFSGASFLQMRYGWGYGVPAYLLASFVGYSRIEARKHYLEDVLAGAALGVLSSYLYIEGRHQEHYSLNLDPSFIKLSYSQPF